MFQVIGCEELDLSRLMPKTMNVQGYHGPGAGIARRTDEGCGQVYPFDIVERVVFHGVTLLLLET